VPVWVTKNGCVGVSLLRKKKTRNQIFLGSILPDLLKYTDFIQNVQKVTYTYIAVAFIIKDVVFHVNISSR
jgi:hypothetical protein